MTATADAIWGLLLIITQGFSSFQRRPYWGYIIPIITGIFYIARPFEHIFYLLLGEVGLHFITRLSYHLFQNSRAKKQLSAIDKMRVKDLR